MPISIVSQRSHARRSQFSPLSCRQFLVLSAGQESPPCTPSPPCPGARAGASAGEPARSCRWWRAQWGASASRRASGTRGAPCRAAIPPLSRETRLRGRAPAIIRPPGVTPDPGGSGWRLDCDQDRGSHPEANWSPIELTLPPESLVSRYGREHKGSDTPPRVSWLRQHASSSGNVYGYAHS